MSRLPRVAVIGGSLGGLFAGVALRQAGFTVDVYERSDVSLRDRGAGLRMQEDMVHRLESARISVDASAVRPQWSRFLGLENQVVHQEATRMALTSWNELYKLLRENLDPGSHHLGKNAVSLQQQADGVEIAFADGTSAACDIAVGADGLTSSVRQWLAPDEGPRYAGYVCWRGIAPELAVSPAGRELLADATTYALLSNGHIAAYHIPGPDGSMLPGERGFNYVWYRNLAEPAMQALMVDRGGKRRQWSIPLGQLKDVDVSEVRQAARNELPGAFAEIVCASDPFIQLMVDVEVSRMVHGRVCLVGDAAFSGRPHLGAGTAKASADAWALAEELSATPDDIDAALVRWEARQLPLGQGYVAANRFLGNALQIDASIAPEQFSSRTGWSNVVRDAASKVSSAAPAALSPKEPFLT